MTWASPRANAESVPGRITITSSPLFAVALYSTVITTTLVPLSRASVIQWLSGILVVIQFIPQTRRRFAFSASNSSQSEVWSPWTMGWPGGRSVCQE
jgi:hypothetical protein